jgi:hypothetical protein
MTGDDNGHGVDATAQITAKDNPGDAAATAAAGTGGADPTQGGRTEPIGGADGQGAQLHKPDGIPDHVLGQSDQETIDKLFTAYKGARDELAKGKPAIPKAGEYKFEWSDAVKGAGGIASDDEAVKAFAEIANEHGYTQQQIDAIPKFFDKLVEKGVIEKPFDSARMLEDLAPAEFRGTPEQRQAKGGERLNQAEAFIGQLTAEQGFSDAMKQELRLLTTSVEGVRVVEAFMRSGMNASVSAGAGGRQTAVTKADLQARTADPRNDAFGSKFDPDFAEETRKMFKQLYPD